MSAAVHLRLAGSQASGDFPVFTLHLIALALGLDACITVPGISLIVGRHTIVFPHAYPADHLLRMERFCDVCMNQYATNGMCPRDPEIKIVVWVLFTALSLPMICVAFQMCVQLPPS